MPLTKDQVRRELEKIGYKNVPDEQLDEFTADLQRLIRREQGSRGSHSRARSAAPSSPSSVTTPSSPRAPARDSSFKDHLPLRPKTAGISTRTKEYFMDDSGTGRTTSPGYSESGPSTSGRPKRKVYRNDFTRVDRVSSSPSSGQKGYSTDGYDEGEETEESQAAAGARPYPRLSANPIVPPEKLPSRQLAKPGFRVTCEMLAHPIRSDPTVRIKWYRDYWSSLKIPGDYRHFNIMNSIRSMLDTYDYLPRPLNKREPVWYSSLLREQPSTMVKMNYC